MVSSTFLRVAVAAAWLATGLTAQAGTLTFNGPFHGNYNTVSVATPATSYAPSYTGGPAGGFRVTLSNFSGTDSAFNGLAFEAYCVDVYEYISTGSYDIAAASAYFSDASKVTALGRLVSYVYGNDLFGIANVDKDAQSTALQLAIWNIVYDTDSAAANALTSGAFTGSLGSSVTFSGTYMNAQTLLTNALNATGGPAYDLYVLSSGRPMNATAGRQDQLIWRPSTVPEPASLALVGLALGGAGLASRRRRA